MSSVITARISKEGYKKLEEGQDVEFDIIQGPKGPQADDVKLVKSTDS